ncbi:MAG: hypothetical protein L0Z62_15340, partial [Gemmataceae bacterium]|nr:hypothetical protein [Gemmataceae bacterium]
MAGPEQAEDVARLVKLTADDRRTVGKWDPVIDVHLNRCQDASERLTKAVTPPAPKQAPAGPRPDPGKDFLAKREKENPLSPLAPALRQPRAAPGARPQPVEEWERLAGIAGPAAPAGPAPRLQMPRLYDGPPPPALRSGLGRAGMALFLLAFVAAAVVQHVAVARRHWLLENDPAAAPRIHPDSRGTPLLCWAFSGVDPLVVRRWLEPACVLGLGVLLALGQQALGSYLLFSAFCLFMDEKLILRQERAFRNIQIAAEKEAEWAREQRQQLRGRGEGGAAAGVARPPEDGGSGGGAEALWQHLDPDLQDFLKRQ